MNNELRRVELAHFLRTRRERLSPDLFQLPEGAKRRRTPGLRREELAQIAGISSTWYTKLEQGQDIQVSTQVLESLARVFALTPAEQTHLYLLARQQLPVIPQKRERQIGSDLQRLLNTLAPQPAIMVDERWDIVGWNKVAARIFGDYSQLADWERNLIWMMFTQADQRTLFVHWDCWAQRFLGLFRSSGGYGVDEDWFIERRDRLMEVSSEFRTWWEMHEVGAARMDQLTINHPDVGTLKLQVTALRVVEYPDLQMFVYTPLPLLDTPQKLLDLYEGNVARKEVKELKSLKKSPEKRRNLISVD